MSCQLPGCSRNQRVRCSRCKLASWCSREHQITDWIRHRRQCIVRLVGNVLDPGAEFLVMHTQPDVLPSPAWLDATFYTSWLGRGSYGLVLLAVPRADPSQQYALKLMFGDEVAVAREAHIAMLLASLYIDNAPRSRVRTPVVKTYDYGKAMWPIADVRRLLEQTHAPTQQDYSAWLSEWASQSEVPVSALTMEMAGPNTLWSLMIYPVHLSADEYAQAMVSVLLQVLLTLNDLQHMVHAVHYDLRADNVLVQQEPQPVVYHWTASSDMAYTLRTQYTARLADFGMARLEYSGPSGQGLVFDADIGYDFAEGAPRGEAYRPWADMQLLAVSLMLGMPYYRVLQLPRSPLWTLLAAMTAMQTAPGEPLALVHAYFQALSTQASSPSADQHRMASAAAESARSRVADPLPDTPLPSARTVLHATRALFANAVAQPGEQIFDMSLHVGDQSSATQAAWAAVQ